MRTGLIHAAVAVALATGGTAVAVATTSGSASSAVSADAALVATLDQVLADPRLAGTTTALQVRDAATGEVVYSHNAAQRVVPASNEKILTSVAALEVLGLDHRFHTTVAHSGARKGRTVTGNLYLRGQGDPTLTGDRIDAIAVAVAAAGITRVDGALIADDSWFDAKPLGLDWSWEDEPFAFNAPISALTFTSNATFDTGAVAVQTGPGRAGAPAVVRVTPANSVVKVVNRAVTGAAGSASTISATREHATNTITVTGSAPLDATPKTSLVTVPDPTKVTVGVFRDALRRHGVRVRGGTRTAATPGTAKTITDSASVPLRELLPYFLKLSNNGHAELLTKAMGRAVTPSAPGSWTTGLAAIRGALARLGVDTAQITIGDGSGLTRRNWVTTAQVANLLQAAQVRPWFDTWYAALPVAGNPDPLIGGTLASRMRGTPAAGNLHGKTGTLSGVNALSGYVDDRAGRRLLFAGISNTASTNVSDLLDTAAVAMASSGGVALARRQLSAVDRHVVTLNGKDVECSWVPNAC